MPDTGSTRGDLLALMRDAVERLPRPAAAPADAQPRRRHAPRPELARTVREGFLATRRAALRGGARRGVERGDLRADLDVELALDVLGGPLFYRLLITGGPIDEQLAEGVADLILRGFAPDDQPRRTR